MTTDNWTLPGEVGAFLKIYCVGRQKAIKAQDLAHKFQVDLREINEVIRTLRKEGVLIGSSKQRPFGYYLPATKEEINEYLNTFKSELHDMLDTFNKQKRARHKFLDSLVQEELFIETKAKGQFAFAF